MSAKEQTEKGNRCGRCGWALYDGCWCQNKHCLHSGKEPPTRIQLTTQEWCEWSAEKMERLETELSTLRNDVRRLVEAAKNLLAESESATRAACKKYAEPYGNGTDSEHAMRTLLKELEANNPSLKPE